MIINPYRFGIPIEQVIWLGKVNVTEETLGTLALNGSSTVGNWDGGAYSSQSFASGNVKVEAKISNPFLGFFLGLSNATDAAANSSYANIDFAVFIFNGGTAQAWENGVGRTLSANVVPAVNDRISVSIESGTVVYRVNNTVIATNNAPTLNYPLKVDMTISGTTAKLLEPKIYL